MADGSERPRVLLGPFPPLDVVGPHDDGDSSAKERWPRGTLSLRSSAGQVDSPGQQDYS